MDGKTSAEIRYLYHSGFAVKTAAHTLIFDYYSNSPAGHGKGFDAGVVDPEELLGNRPVVFVSHRHGDHYNPVIFTWRGAAEPRYVISDDVPGLKREKDILPAAPGRRYDLGDLKVETLRSTDEGVAFLIEADGLTIYHAGDLNWWHWEGEADDCNRKMAEDYKREIDRLRGRKIDLAFVPVDPRLEKDYLRGIGYFMEAAGAALVFPMHFGEDYGIISKLKHDPHAAAYRDRVAVITRRGEMFRYPAE